jgi:hypothetical protein
MPGRRDLPELGADQPQLLVVEVRLTRQRCGRGSSSGGRSWAASHANRLAK